MTHGPEHTPGEALLDAIEPGAAPTGEITFVRDPLSWRAELRRQWGRRRTTWAFGLLLALPLVLVASFAFGQRSNNNRGGATTRIFDLAQSGAANFSLVLVFLASELLLVLLAALFCGDAVPSEASWASLRYLLVAPVQRARLLTSKLVIGVASTLLATVLLPAWGLLVGGVAYGWDPLTNPIGENLTWGQFLPRLAAGDGLHLRDPAPDRRDRLLARAPDPTPRSRRSAAPCSFSILLNILDQLDALDPYRNAFPGHYSRAWQDALAVTPDYDGHGPRRAVVARLGRGVHDARLPPLPTVRHPQLTGIEGVRRLSRARASSPRG